MTMFSRAGAKGDLKKPPPLDNDHHSVLCSQTAVSVYLAALSQSVFTPAELTSITEWFLVSYGTYTGYTYALG